MYTIRKQLYLSVSVAVRLEVIFRLQSSSNIASVICRDLTFVFVLNYRLTAGTKKTGKKKIGKKACSSAYTIRKELYSSVSVPDKLEVTFYLQSSSNLADMSALSVMTRHSCLYTSYRLTTGTNKTGKKRSGN